MSDIGGEASAATGVPPGTNSSYFNKSVLALVSTNDYDPTKYIMTYSDGSQDVFGQVIYNNTTYLRVERIYLSESIDPQGHSTKFHYDLPMSSNGVARLISIEDPAGLLTTLTYDDTNPYNTNFIKTVTDPFGKTATLTYDDDGFLTNIQDVAGISSSFAYGTKGYMTSMTTPYGTTSFLHVEPDEPIVWTVDGNENRLDAFTEITKPNGDKELFAFLSLLAAYLPNTVTNGPAGTPLGTLSTNLLTANNSFYWGPHQYTQVPGTNITSFTTNNWYLARRKHWLQGTDQSGGLGVNNTLAIEQASSADGITPGHMTFYDYEGKTDPDYAGITLDPAVIAYLKNGGNTILDSLEYLYNLGNQRTNLTRADGSFVAYTYDDIGQLKTAIGKEGVSTVRSNELFGYSYDAAGNLNYRTNNALIQTFNVNSLNELTSASRSGTLTVAGMVTTNVAAVTVNGTNANLYTNGTFAVAGFSLVDGTNSFSAVGTDGFGRTSTDNVSVYLPASLTYTYDLNGNLTFDGNRAFEYDDENQLVAITVTNAWRSEFTYDGLNRRRVRKEFVWNGTWSQNSETRYIYDGMLVVQEREGNNLPSVTYTRGLDLSGTRRGAGGIGGLLARSDHSSLIADHSFYYSDGGGNVTMLIDSEQHVAARYFYDPYGNTLSASGPLAEANLNRFSGKEFHQNSGTHYYGYRFYDSNLQRWQTRDPIGEAGGINLYKFIGNRPPGAIDPFGLDPETELISAIIRGDAQAVADILEAYEGILTDAQVARGQAALKKFEEAALRQAAEACKAAKKAADAAKKAKELEKIRKQRDALDKLKTLKEAQKKNPSGIRSTAKSEQNVKKLLKDIENDPSVGDDL